MEKVRIQDDLYHFVNDEWIEKAVIPDDLPCSGGFSDLDINVEKTLMGDFKAMAEGKKKIPNAYLDFAVRLYEKGLDLQKRNKQGISPLLPSLKRVEDIADLAFLNSHLASFLKIGVPLPFRISIEPNMKDTAHYSFCLIGPTTFLPDVTYYSSPELKAQKEALLGVFSSMSKSLLSFTPLSENDKAVCLKDALAFDEVVATLVKSQEEWSEYVKCYNPMPSEEVEKLLEPLDFERLLKELFLQKPTQIIVYEPRFLKGFATLLNEKTFILYKHWAYLKTLLSASNYLSEEIRTIGNAYRRTLTGAVADPSIEKQSYREASGAFSEPIGLYYGKTYFGEKAKDDVTKIVKDIIATYKKRIANNDFLSEPTKEKAILKLSKIVIKMGYPDKCSPMYERLKVEKDSSFYDAVAQIDEEKREYEFSRLYIDVDRTEWVMAGHVVNACYNPYSNDITFPAAMLQAPFYSLKQTRSENLGGIGAVIGHEISHAFDNNGASCDENGNLNNWWTETDFAAFKKKTEAMVKEFDGLPFAGGKVNGAFVVSENIADNGGMAVTLDIMGQTPGASYQEYFMNWARVWCMKARPQYEQLLLSIDVHSPSELRANMAPRNFKEWYEAFGVSSSDKMYLPPEERVDLW